MTYGYGQCSDPVGQRASSDDEVILASSCPKKRAGRKKFKETRHPVYRGVRQRNGNRWVCELRTPNNKSRIWLGTYPTAEMAARAHDVAALALRGRTACLNFADSAWRLPVPNSTNTKDIQQAAAEAAEAFRTHESSELSVESSTRVNYDEVSTGENQIISDRVIHHDNDVYMDEEAVFNMPRLLENMAEGLLLTPPHAMYGDFTWDDKEADSELSLWSYSI